MSYIISWGAENIVVFLNYVGPNLVVVTGGVGVKLPPMFYFPKPCLHYGVLACLRLVIVTRDLPPPEHI